MTKHLNRKDAFNDLDVENLPVAIAHALETLIARNPVQALLRGAGEVMMIEAAKRGPGYSETELLRSVGALIRRVQGGEVQDSMIATGRITAMIDKGEIDLRQGLDL